MNNINYLSYLFLYWLICCFNF